MPKKDSKAKESKSKTTKSASSSKSKSKPKTTNVKRSKVKTPIKDSLVSGASSSSKTPQHSDLHPEKLTFERFSDRQRSLDDDSLTIGRLILYVVIVVAIGVGLTLAVQSYIQSQNSAEEVAESQETSSSSSELEENVTAIDSDNSIQKDFDALPTILDDDQFLVDSSKDGIAISELTEAWDLFTFRRYETVERIGLEMTEDVSQPEYTIEYEDGSDTLYIEIANLGTPHDELSFGSEILKLDTDTNTVLSVQNVSTDPSNVRLAIYLSESVRYSAQFYNGDLYVDLRQADLVVSESPGGEVVDEDDQDDVVNDDSQDGDIVSTDEWPDAPFYDNDYSKETQYISSEYEGNALRVWNYTYRDWGDRYEFKFRIKDDGSDVSPMKPNVKAYLNDNSSDPKLIVEIYNINWEILDKYEKAECFDGVGYGNVKNICGKFDEENNMVTYEISLQNLADFEVDSVDNTQYDPERPGEVIWVKIKDN